MSSKSTTRSLLIAALVGGGTGWASAQNRPARPKYAQNQVLVKFRSLPSGVTSKIRAAQFSAVPSEVRDLLTRYRIVSLRKIFPSVSAHSTLSVSSILQRQVTVPDLYGWTVLELPPGTDVPTIVSQLKGEGTVEAAEPNYTRAAIQVVPNDPLFSKQWFHKNGGTNLGLSCPGNVQDNVAATSGSDIHSTVAWGRETGSRITTVAVIDTGIQLNHPDLAANIISLTPSPASYDFVNNSTPDDDNGHGTHVAGIVGAVGNNNVEVSGVNWLVKLMPVKVLDATGSGTTDAIDQGIVFAANNGARVINLSLGGPSPSQADQDAVNYAMNVGAVVVAAAGNYDPTDPNDPNNPNPCDFPGQSCYPAAYPGVIAVAATDENDKIASYSQYGTWVSIAAPGNNIVSTYINSSTFTDCGTSMAAPMVAGAAGLILSRFPGLSTATVTSRILNGADNINSVNSSLIGQIGAGRLNLTNAVAIQPSVLSFTATPNNSFVQNGSSISFTAVISSETSAPQVSVSLVDQQNRPLTNGNSVSFSVSNQVNVTGTVQLGNLSLNYPTATMVKLRFDLSDTLFSSTADVKTWGFAELGSLPPGGNASVWNGILNPTKGDHATVRLALGSAGHVKIKIYTLNGTLVKTLADQDVGSSGIQTWDWTGNSDAGRVVASGVYLINISAPGINQTEKAVVVK